MGPKSGETTLVLPGDPPVEVIIRRSRRATRYSLRVSRSDGRVSMSVPLWAPEAEATAFLHARAAWVRRHLADTPVVQRAGIGAQLPLGGTPHPIVAGYGRTARLVDGEIQVPPGPREGPKIKALLSTLARERLAEAVAIYAARLGRAPGRLTLRDPKTRWGSCSARGDLMFSWRLIMAPPEILSYVAAHEVAHLAEMNHSERFWAICRQLEPATDARRTWLKQYGGALMAWRFDVQKDADPC